MYLSWSLVMISWSFNLEYSFIFTFHHEYALSFDLLGLCFHFSAVSILFFRSSVEFLNSELNFISRSLFSLSDWSFARLSYVSLRILLTAIFTFISSLQGSSFVYLGWFLFQVSEVLSVTFWPVCIGYWRRLRQWWTHKKWGWKGFSVLTWRGWTGQVGREAQGGGAVCIHAADSLRCTAESNTALSSNYTPVLLLLFKKDVSSPGGWVRKGWWDSSNSQCVSGCMGITWPESLSKLWDYFLRFYRIC